MSREELSIARKFLTAFEEVKGEQDTKMAQLFDLLTNSDHTLTEAELEEKLYKKEARQAFNKLVIRVKEKVFESLTLDINLNRKDTLSEQYKTIYFIQKKIIEASIIHGRGMTGLAIEIQDQIIEKCKTFELFDELISVMNNKRQTLGLRLGAEQFDKISEEIAYYETCRKAVYKASHYFFKLNSYVVSKARNDYMGLLSEAISDLQEAYKQTHSARIAQYLHYLLMEFYQEHKEFEKSLEENLKLIELLQSNKAVHEKKAIGVALFQLANNRIYLYQFDSVIENSMQSIGLLPKDSFNYGMAREMMVYSHFYTGRHDKALDILEDLLTNKFYTPSELWKSRRNYLKASVLFAMGNYRDSYAVLQETKEIEADKEGWNIGIRMLTIITDVERVLLDNADCKIESMRKHVERTSKIASVRKRDIVICKLLMELVNSSFDFNKVLAKNEATFQALASPDDELGWEIKSHEMIIFHQWFMAKAKGIPFVQKVVPPSKKPNTLPVAVVVPQQKNP